jgi:hypothetical protein
MRPSYDGAAPLQCLPSHGAYRERRLTLPSLTSCEVQSCISLRMLMGIE